MYTIVFVFLAFSCTCLADNISFRYGGLGDHMDATSKTQQLVDSVSIGILGGGGAVSPIILFNLLWKSDSIVIAFILPTGAGWYHWWAPLGIR